MGRAARAIIKSSGGDQLLVMHRDKYGSKYFTLVGGRVQDNESPEQALVREIKEETGLEITSARLVFVEEHPEPNNSQYIYLCEVAPYDKDMVAISDYSEEGMLNRMEMNLHKPMWVEAKSFNMLQFRTPNLHKALVKALKHGFPGQPIKL